MAETVLSPTLPILYTTGSYYEVGFNIGSFFANRIKSYFQKSDRVQKIFLPYLSTENGQRFFQDVLNVCQENLPEHVREVQGMADGCGLSFKDIFLLNIWKEIQNVLVFEEKAMDSLQDSRGCTAIMVNTPNTKLIAHNEDCEPLIAQCAYLVDARVVEGGEEVEHFTAFCYPGTLPGCAFSFNKHGLVFTMNELFLDFVAHHAPTQMFIQRAVLKARNIDEAVRILKNKGYGVAYGFCTNVYDTKCPSKMWSIEVAAQADEALVHVHTLEEEADVEKPCHYFHVNSYDHLPFQHLNLIGSERRKRRANEMKPPRTVQDMLDIEGDTKDELYPIFRSPRPTDDSVTLCTVVGDILQKKMYIYMGNPAVKGVKPLITLSISEENCRVESA